MKGKAVSFAAGVLAGAALLAAPISAQAADGAFSLTAYPIRVLVNGEVFQPKDAQGRDVLVFNYDGTVYAPLRALAEAYGLEVGYDAVRNIATVNGAAAETAASGAFGDLWEVKEKPVTNYGDEHIFTAAYCGPLETEAFKAWWKGLDPDYVRSEAEQMAADARSGGSITMYFSCDGHMLGTAYAVGGSTQSNFGVAAAWIR